MKKVIINADDFGYSKEVNEAVMHAYNSGSITSASLMANMSGFDNAIFDILPYVNQLDVGFHFNIAEGKSLSNSKFLCDSSGNFNKDFIGALIHSGDKKYLLAIETEFRMQIEKVLEHVNISHIDSHRHIHAIPAIYELFKRMAKEYNIKHIRKQNEKFYIVKNKVFNKKFPINVVKHILLNNLTKMNDKEINSYFIGVLYTGNMDLTTVLKGIKAINKNDCIIEVVLHPTTNKNAVNNYNEYKLLTANELKQNINALGCVLTDFRSVISRTN